MSKKEEGKYLYKDIIINFLLNYPEKETLKLHFYFPDLYYKYFIKNQKS